MIVRKRKYQNGGVRPTPEEKRKQMLATGRWTEGPNGELLRVPQQNMFGFPTAERIQELSQRTEPLNERELGEYIRYGFDPTNPVNTAFSMIAGAHPAGAAADVVGNAIGAGLGYVARGGKQLINFLRPKADEATEAAVNALVREAELDRAFKVMRDDYEQQVMDFMAYEEDELLEILAEGEAGVGMFGDEELDYAREALRRLRGGNRITPDAYLAAGTNDMEGITGDWVQAVWDDRVVFGRDRLDPSFNVVDLGPVRNNMRQSEFFDYVALSDNEKKKYLEDLIARPQGDFQKALDEITGLLKQRKAEVASPEGQRRMREQIKDDIAYFRGLASQSDEALKKMKFTDEQIDHLRYMVGNIDTKGEEGYIKAVMTRENQRIQNIQDISQEENFQWVVDTENKLKDLVQKKQAALQNGDFDEVDMLNMEIGQLENWRQRAYEEMANDALNAFYDTSADQIKVGRAYLQNPEVARSSAAHEFQHGMLTDRPFDSTYRDFYTGQPAALPRTTEADRILHEELDLLDGYSIVDLPVDEQQKVFLFTEGEYMKSPPLDERGLLTGHAGMGSEMTPFAAELREALVDEGIMRHRHDYVTPEQIEKYLHQYRMRDPSYASGYPYIPEMNAESIRILEVLNPESDAQNARAISKALNKMLVAVPAVGAAGVAAGTTAEEGSTYYKGGKLKLKKSAACGMRVAKK